MIYDTHCSQCSLCISVVLGGITVIEDLVLIARTKLLLL